jgi:(p)ppGpp synthase/HD superfamily hydrolase
LIRAQWPETDPTRLKDYIARPKTNGYKSLHHTSKINSKGIQFPFEVQVRSFEMHTQAEFGVSAHWDYKLAGQKEGSPGTLVTMAQAASSFNETTALWALSEESMENVAVDMPTLSSSRDLSESYVDALMTAKHDILKKQIYVFIVGGPEAQDQGELISVPVDTSVGDAIEDIEGMLSARVQVWRNGRAAGTTDKLENGDFMMIHV